MSRDFTPREHLESEKLTIAKCGASIWDFLENTTMTFKGETWPLCSSEELALRKQYPYLGKLLENFDEVYAAVSKYNCGLDVLREKDNELKNYAETDKECDTVYLTKWFDGELDPHFHYHEQNDKLFCDELLIEIIAREVYTEYFSAK